MRFMYIGELVRTPDACDHMGIIQGLEWLKWDYKIVDPVLNDDDHVVKEIAEFNPDVIVHGNTDTLRGDILHRIKKETDAKQVFWMLDYQPADIVPLYNGHWDIWTTAKGALDAIFLSNYDQLEGWADAFDCPAHFLPHGCYVLDELVYDESKKHDMLFIGSMTDGGWYKDRFDMLKRLEPFHHINAHDVAGRNKIWREMPALYHSSNCVLDISHEWKAKGYSSGRYWYTAGLGGCSITKRFPGCEEFYRHKKEKLYFDTVQEARNWMVWCQENPEGVHIIKTQAYHHNKINHNYEKRFTSLVTKL